jgi:lysine 2,3-aminomutase
MTDPRSRFPGVSAEEWSDWRWQQRHMLRSAEDLARVVTLTEDERQGLARTAGRFRVGVTPYYASLMDPVNPHCPVRMQVIPVAAEAEEAPGDLRDPLGEDHHRPVRSVVHKYPDRALLLASDHCATYCRHCTRRRITGGEEGAFDRVSTEEGLAWIAAHPRVREVIVSGGDPLSLADERILGLLGALRAIPHVEVIRLATRAPAVNPARITDDLARSLRALAPLFVITHFNHPKECTAEARAACERLVDHGVPVENQAVLLRRVNSSARTVADLHRRLLAWRVRPYYLHQGDLAEGTAHLRTPLAAGLSILEGLRGHVSGLAVPHLAVDLPGGRGKVTLQPSWLVGPGRADAGPGAEATPGVAPPGRAAGHWIRSWRGEPTFYPEPPDADCDCPYDEVFYGGGGTA